MTSQKTIYADYSATTPVREEVINEMLKLFKEDFGNPSSIHRYGKKAKTYLEAARENIASIINAHIDEIYFTSGGTESNNSVIKGIETLLQENKIKKNKHIITTKIEHPSVKTPIEELQKRGWKITWLNVDKEGFINLEELKSTITDQTALVSIIHANNEIGTIQNLKNISLICKDHNVLFHTDTVQSFCKIPINTKDLNIDFLTTSGHKIYGPKGIGALYINSSTTLPSFIIGGGQEKNFRSGTENVPGAVGFGVAAKLLNSEMQPMANKLRKYQIQLIEKLSSFQHNNFIFTGPGLNKIKENLPIERFLYRIPGHVSLCFRDIEGESIVLQADLQEVALSSGSACSSLDSKSKTPLLEPSHVITALNIPLEYSNGSLRITLGKYSGENDINQIVQSLHSVWKNLISSSRAIS